MRSFGQVFIEAVIIGILVIVLGYIVGWLTKPFLGVSLPEVCMRWNKNYMMEINLFLIGFIFHMVSEYSGLNVWFCKTYIMDTIVETVGGGASSAYKLF